MEKVSKCGLMGLSMRVSGGMEWLRDKALFITLTLMSTLEISKMIEPTDLESMSMLTDKDMKDFGKMICKMDLEKRFLRTVVTTMACLRMVKSVDRAHTDGLIIQCIKAIGMITISKERENTDGQTGGFTKDNGRKTSSTE
jgi:hypothetical protein